jgi:hypothetical protein
MPHITFIHGISNKPEENKLIRIWLEALSNNFNGNNDGIDLGAEGVTTSMIYWADVLYEKTEDILQENVSNFENLEDVAEKSDTEPDMSWRGQTIDEEKVLIDKLATRLSFDILLNDDYLPNEKIGNTLEAIPLPWFVKRRMMKWLLRDVHHYLFNQKHNPRPDATYMVQEEIRSRVLRKLNEVNTDIHIVIAHSMGTVIMYDCLFRVEDCPKIDGFMTIGSPLGIDEIQEMLKPEWSRNNGFPTKLAGDWINIYDKFDPVTGFDGNISNDFMLKGKKVIHVINEQNHGPWRHNITNYLSKPMLRKALKKLLNF